MSWIESTERIADNLHIRIHERIDTARKDVEQARARQKMIDLMKEIAKDSDVPKTDTVTTAIAKVDNMYLVQAEDRLEFFQRLHDELYPDGIEEYDG